jgi:hypothetical protein
MVWEQIIMELLPLILQFQHHHFKYIWSSNALMFGGRHLTNIILLILLL